MISFSFSDARTMCKETNRVELLCNKQVHFFSNWLVFQTCHSECTDKCLDR